MEYKVKILDSCDWSKADKANIDKYVWGGSYRPQAYAQLCIVPKEGLHVRMCCMEDNPKAVHTQFYEEVWLDSAMEFFFGFDMPGVYINCEMNSLGNSLIGVGEGRANRRRIDEFCDIPVIKAEKKPGEWSVETLFREDMLKAVFGKVSLNEGDVFYGNFFKVGEETHTPHYGMWNPIVWEKPDFHRPECFGKFIAVGG